MSDVFESAAPAGERERLWRLIDATPNLRWQLLSKRPERIVAAVPPSWRSEAPANVWYGTSIENADYLWRATALCAVPARIRFLSLEPLLGPLSDLSLAGIHWVIVGGESGRRARPMKPAWVRAIRDRCIDEGVPFFFKQWGEWDASGMRTGKRRSGRELDGVTWSEIPKARGGTDGTS